MLGHTVQTNDYSTRVRVFVMPFEIRHLQTAGEASRGRGYRRCTLALPLRFIYENPTTGSDE